MISSVGARLVFTTDTLVNINRKSEVGWNYWLIVFVKTYKTYNKDSYRLSTEEQSWY